MSSTTNYRNSRADDSNSLSNETEPTEQMTDSSIGENSPTPATRELNTISGHNDTSSSPTVGRQVQHSPPVMMPYTGGPRIIHRPAKRVRPGVVHTFRQVEARPPVHETGEPSNMVPPVIDPTQERQYQMLLNIQLQHLQNTNRLSYQIDGLLHEIQNTQATLNAARQEIQRINEERNGAKGFFARIWSWIWGK